MRYDIIVMGCGLAGMIAIARFASAGFSVLGIEHHPDTHSDEQDLRSTAFLMPSIRVLEKAGLWDNLVSQATPIQTMEIVDAKQNPSQSVAFQAEEIGEDQFGYNLMNAALRQNLRTQLAALKNVTLRFETKISALMQFDQYIALRTETGEAFETRILVGADGRNSQTRNLLKIETDIAQLDQMAQVFTVCHTAPHHNISTEIHQTGGPFTLVPRQDIDGQHASAVVWMDHADAIKTRAAMSDADFHETLNARAHGIRGALTKCSPIGCFPMITLEARKLHNHRAVIIGEAAHVVPPIGAQGLNMSLKDCESLVRVLERGGIEHPKYLANWGYQRSMDIAIRERGIKLLNNVSIGDFGLAELTRRIGLESLEKQSPLRRGLMKFGLGS